MTTVTPRTISRRRPAAAAHADAKIRLILLWGLLSNGEAQSPAMLADRFKVTVRTIHRDIKVIQQAGYQIKFDRKTDRYYCGATGFLPPLDFRQDEAVALMLLGRHVSEDPVLEDAANRALGKIRSHLPPALQDQLAALEHRVTVNPVGTDNAQAAGDAYHRMQQAIREQRQVQCKYDAVRSSENGGGDRQFFFCPYHLLFSNRAWYVIGYREDRKSMRSLKLIRFTQITPTNKSFKIPADFTVAGYLGQCWRLIPGGTRRHIVMQIDPHFATGIAETQWHSTQVVENQPDGSAIIQFDVDGLEEIVWWILGLGPHCRVLEPRELVLRVQELALQTAKLYGK